VGRELSRVAGPIPVARPVNPRRVPGFAAGAKTLCVTHWMSSWPSPTISPVNAKQAYVKAGPPEDIWYALHRVRLVGLREVQIVKERGGASSPLLKWPRRPGHAVPSQRQRPVHVVLSLPGVQWRGTSRRVPPAPSLASRVAVDGGGGRTGPST